MLKFRISIVFRNIRNDRRLRRPGGRLEKFYIIDYDQILRAKKITKFLKYQHFGGLMKFYSFFRSLEMN